MKRLTAKAVLIGLTLGLIVSPIVSAQAAAKAGDKVNINTASLAELEKLPRIGPQISASGMIPTQAMRPNSITQRFRTGSRTRPAER